MGVEHKVELLKEMWMIAIWKSHNPSYLKLFYRLLMRKPLMYEKILVVCKKEIYYV
jgi:hypothetical protein